jgi:hypothetical protein
MYMYMYMHTHACFGGGGNKFRRRRRRWRKVYSELPQKKEKEEEETEAGFFTVTTATTPGASRIVKSPEYRFHIQYLIQVQSLICVLRLGAVVAGTPAAPPALLLLPSKKVHAWRPSQTLAVL